MEKGSNSDLNSLNRYDLALLFFLFWYTYTSKAVNGTEIYHVKPQAIDYIFLKLQKLCKSVCHFFMIFLLIYFLIPIRRVEFITGSNFKADVYFQFYVDKKFRRYFFHYVILSAMWMREFICHKFHRTLIVAVQFVCVATLLYLGDRTLASRNVKAIKLRFVAFEIDEFDKKLTSSFIHYAPSMYKCVENRNQNENSNESSLRNQHFHVKMSNGLIAFFKKPCHLTQNL